MTKCSARGYIEGREYNPADDPDIAEYVAYLESKNGGQAVDPYIAANADKVLEQKPHAGMQVTYKNNGYVRNIIPAIVLKVSYGAYKPVGDYHINTHRGVANVINIYGNSVRGYGWLTTFDDTWGDHDNRLKKGDVATKKDYMDPIHNSIVYVTACQKGSGSIYGDNPTGDIKEVPMYKNDHGTLPYAVLDIWKDGVNYWGYHYNDNLSLEGIFCHYR